MNLMKPKKAQAKLQMTAKEKLKFHLKIMKKYSLLVVLEFCRVSRFENTQS